MFAASDKQLHWSQRIALVRHNLHAARRNGDFSFFKTLQAHAFLQGTDYVAALTANLGDDADAVLSALDNLNVRVAYVFQSAFKTVYDCTKVLMMEATERADCTEAQLRVEIFQQTQRADFAIDRIVNSATALIQLQPAEFQNDVACAWMLGVTIITDAVSVCMREVNDIESSANDSIRLENSWSTVQTAVESAVTALRGILNLMAIDENTEDYKRRSSSSVSAIDMLRKFSTALGTSFYMANPLPPYSSSSKQLRESRAGSASTRLSSVSTQSSVAPLRQSSVNATPTKLLCTPSNGIGINGTNGFPTPLAPIPRTPGVVDEDFKFDVPTPNSENGRMSEVDVKDHSVKSQKYVPSILNVQCAQEVSWLLQNTLLTA